MLSKGTSAQEPDSVASHLYGSGIRSNSDIREVVDNLPNSASNVADLVKKLHRARPYIFKKKTPLPGAYPLNFSPYQLASHHPSKNAVNLTPAEVYSDCKLLVTCIKTDFPSNYFDEEGCTEHSMKPPKPQAPICCPRRDSATRDSSTRYSIRRKKLN
jgi:hypothetical protein